MSEHERPVDLGPDYQDDADWDDADWDDDGLYDDEPAAADPSRTPRRISIAVLLITLLGIIGWTWYEAKTLQSEALAAVDPLRQIDPSPKALQEDLLLLKSSSRHAKRAREAADSLPLRIAGKLPFLGDDVQAARTMATALDNVVDEAGIPLVQLLDGMMTKPSNAPASALINTEPLKTAGPKVLRAAEVVKAAHTELAEINVGKINDQLSLPVVQATQLLAPLDKALTDTYRYLPVISNALGVNGPRDYLLVFQNLAEARPTGGIIGKWATIGVDKSAISLKTIGVNEDLTALSLRQTPPMPKDFIGLYGKSLGPVANANLTPDFPSAAKLVLATWKQQGRPAPAGVVSVDTKAIAGLLSLTGPISVQGPDGPVVVASDNVVDIVQNRVYTWFAGQETARQNFLTDLTGKVLLRMAEGDVPVRNLATTLQQLAGQGEVAAYSTTASEQKVMEDLGISGALPTPTPNRAMAFFTDNGGSKLDHYLRVGVCSNQTKIGLSLVNNIPADYARSLPDYVLNQRKGSSKGSNMLTVAFYLPAGRGMSGLTVNGTSTATANGTEKGWSVVRVPLELKARTTTKVVANLSGKPSTPTVRTQPLTHNVTKANGVCGK